MKKRLCCYLRNAECILQQSCFRNKIVVCFPGLFFIVEADIKAFTQLKLDKRFYSILNILRHCQRLREVRGSGLVRYIIC